MYRINLIAVILPHPVGSRVGDLPLVKIAYYYSSFKINRVSVLPLHAAWICPGSIGVVWLLKLPILSLVSCTHLANIVTWRCSNPFSQCCSPGSLLAQDPKHSSLSIAPIG